MNIPIESGYDGDDVCIIIGKKGKIVSGLGLCWEEVGVAGRFHKTMLCMSRYS